MWFYQSIAAGFLAATKLKKKLKKISFVDQKTFEKIINAKTWEPSENKAPASD